MTKFNKTFELSIEDLDLIEAALRRKKRALSDKRLKVAGTPGGPTTQAPMLEELDNTLRGIHELMGRLHNQKTFYRPQNTPYIGG